AGGYPRRPVRRVQPGHEPSVRPAPQQPGRRQRDSSMPGGLISRHTEDFSAMFLARVTGSVVATQKVASMTGHKLLTVEPYKVDDKSAPRLVPTGRTFVVVDTLGAGIDEMVLI